MPGRQMSSAYFPAPVVLAAASTIAVALPIIEKPFVVGRCSLAIQPRRSVVSSDGEPAPVLGARHRLLLRLNCGFNCLVHLVIAGAAAEVPAEGAANFIFGRVRIPGEQVFHGHHEAGSAVSTLRSSPIAIGLLNRCQASVLADAFDSGDLLAFAAGGEQG